MSAARKAKIDPVKLEALQGLTVDKGNHKSFDRGHCALELVSWLADEPLSDKPACTCPVIGAFVISWNDSMQDEERTRVLRPLLPLLVNTRYRDDEVLLRRMWIAIDWHVRERLPAFLRTAGLIDLADTIAGATRIVNQASLEEVRPAISAAHSAAISAAHSAADSAAHSAAISAAHSAATASLADTVAEVQASAVECVKRMCAVKPKRVRK